MPDALRYVYRITKYDPADRDEHGRYTGTEDTDSDRGPVEAAYLEALAAFAEDGGVHHLAIREPAAHGIDTEGDHVLAALFPTGLAGYHDGAVVPVAVGLQLVRIMLRGDGAWCRLEAGRRFAVEVGWDQYVYVSSSEPCADAVARTRVLGLFPEPLDASPYAPEHDEPGEQRPADEDFWSLVALTVPRDGALLLEEGFVHNSTRWHRVTRAALDTVRAGLAPRAMLTVWPDFLSEDAEGALGALPDEYPVEVVWEDPDGRICSIGADGTTEADLRSRLAHARSAAVLPITVDDRKPLFTAVLPDDDGVLRARWRTEPTPSDLRWTRLRGLRRGELRTGPVTDIRDYGVFVDIGDGLDGMINAAELSWRHYDRFSDVVTVGEQVTVEILDVDLSRERISLSLKALQEDPFLTLADLVGRTVQAHVTKVMPFGAFVGLGDPRDGLQGLLPTAELAEDVAHVGDELSVRVVDVDRVRRRITLARPPANDRART